MHTEKTTQCFVIMQHMALLGPLPLFERKNRLHLESHALVFVLPLMSSKNYPSVHMLPPPPCASYKVTFNLRSELSCEVKRQGVANKIQLLFQKCEVIILTIFTSKLNKLQAVGR